MNSEQKWPDWVETEADKVLCDVMLNHDSAILAITCLSHYFANPKGKQKLVDTENVATYVCYARDIQKAIQKIMDLIAASEYSHLLNDDN